MPQALTIAGLSLFVSSGCMGAVFLGPTPYLSSADSPFAGTVFNYSFLENFEDGSLNTPGVTVSPGAIIGTPGALTDSVDADDGTINNSGTAGHSLYSANLLTAVRFLFNAPILGALPSHAGIVWTDVGNTTQAPGIGGVFFEAFDALGNSLGIIGPITLGDGASNGGTSEDRFFGVTNAGGISAIEIRMNNSVDWEVDHLQYASIEVPEPEVGLLAALALFALLKKRR